RPESSPKDFSLSITEQIEAAQQPALAPAPAPVAPGAQRPKKKETLPALTGLRCLAALNIVFFHFSNPQWFGPLAPIINNGYTSVSFFLLMSGYILAYNYSERAQKGQLKSGNFWIARFS